MVPSQVCTKASVQQQFSSQNVREIEHCFIALGEALRTAGACLPYCSGSVGGTQTALPPAARSFPKELMKFFISQMEMSKEAIRVGTLTLIRAVVGADGEPRAGRRVGVRRGGFHPCMDLCHFLFCRHHWVG